MVTEETMKKSCERETATRTNEKTGREVAYQNRKCKIVRVQNRILKFQSRMMKIHEIFSSSKYMQSGGFLNLNYKLKIYFTSLQNWRPSNVEIFGDLRKFK